MGGAYLIYFANELTKKIPKEERATRLRQSETRKQKRTRFFFTSAHEQMKTQAAAASVAEHVTLTQRFCLLRSVDPLWTPCGPLVDPLWTPCGSLLDPLWTPPWTLC